jgi:hypothetical protein
MQMTRIHAKVTNGIGNFSMGHELNRKLRLKIAFVDIEMRLSGQQKEMPLKMTLGRRGINGVIFISFGRRSISTPMATVLNNVSPPSLLL